VVGGVVAGGAGGRVDGGGMIPVGGRVVVDRAGDGARLVDVDLLLARVRGWCALVVVDAVVGGATTPVGLAPGDGAAGGAA
jgi:hypothetical protein